MAEYSSDRYQEEKRLGVRDSDGSRPPQKLKPIYIKIIEMHLAGLPNRRIAEEVGKTEAWISIILNKGPVKRLIARIMEGRERELSALFGEAIGVIRKGLSDTNLNVALKASDQFFRTQGKYKDSVKKPETAEDVMRRVVDYYKANGITKVRVSETRITHRPDSESVIPDPLINSESDERLRDGDRDS